MNDNPRILIVDDGPRLLAAALGILRRTGYQVLEATRGAEGLRPATEQRPDLLLVAGNDNTLTLLTEEVP